MAESKQSPRAVDTNNSNGRGRDASAPRYSFTQTPLEYHSPTFPPRHQVPTNPVEPTNVSEPRTARTQSQENENVHNAPPRQHTRTPSEIKPYSPPPADSAIYKEIGAEPPLSAHPANFAPPVDQLSNDRVRSPEPARTSHQPAGSFSTRHNRTSSEAQIQREKEWAIVPDNNPLNPPAHTSNSTSNPGTVGPDRVASPHVTQNGNHIPGQVMHPSQEARGGVWSHSLCDCSDLGLCCMGLWCPCIVYGRTQYRLTMKSEKKDPTNMLGYKACNGPCMGMAFICGFQWLLTTIQNVRIRRTYDLPGDVASDCIRSTCCTCCTLVQDEREVKLREEAIHRKKRSTFGYSPPTHMSFSPPPQ